MKQWEYKTEVATYNRKYLNSRGEEGWELIAVDNDIMYFKREINPPSAERKAKYEIYQEH